MAQGAGREVDRWQMRDGDRREGERQSASSGSRGGFGGLWGVSRLDVERDKLATGRRVLRKPAVRARAGLVPAACVAELSGLGVAGVEPMRLAPA